PDPEARRGTGPAAAARLSRRTPSGGGPQRGLRLPVGPDPADPGRAVARLHHGLELRGGYHDVWPRPASERSGCGGRRQARRHRGRHRGQWNDARIPAGHSAVAQAALARDDLLIEQAGAASDRRQGGVCRLHDRRSVRRRIRPRLRRPLPQSPSYRGFTIMSIHIVDHPLVHDALATLRDKRTTPEYFRRAATQISVLLAAEALRDLPTSDVTVDTPIGPAEGRRVSTDIVVVPILRAGLGMLDAVLEMVPTARVGHIGLQRDETTAVASQYYSKLPPGVDRSVVLMVDPMLATGGSAVAALDVL